MAKGPPIITYALITANIAVFVYGMSLPAGKLFSQWGLWPHYDAAHANIYGGDEWWRWITSGFVHTGVLHVGMNMFVLWMFGRQVEPLLGRARFAAVYAASLLGGSALIAVLGQQGTVAGGASGAIFGIVAAYVAIGITLRLPFQAVALQAGVWLVIGFYIQGIAWQGHLGGALAGWLATAIIIRAAGRKRPPGVGR